MDEERHASRSPAVSPSHAGQDRLSATAASVTSGGGGSKSRTRGGGSRKRVLRSSTLSVSYLEIYNEQLYDLLSFDVDALSAARAAAGVEGNHTLAFGRANGGAGTATAPSAASAMPELTITEDKQGGTHVRGLTRVPVRSAEEALSSLFEGDANRAVAEHALNAASTRSHCVFTLYLERVYTVRGGAGGGSTGSDDEDAATETVRSKLHLVDLAGSERIGKTHTAGGTAVQASFINKSLTFLEQVVLALLSSKREHVPYRSSKLTNMLKDSLGGNCRTRMVACVWPDASHAEESIATLRFATRMMKVKTFVSRNVASSGGGGGAGASSAQVAKLEAEIKALRRELAMHDALVGRTGVRYGPITPAEGGLIADLCESYVDAPSDDEAEGGSSPSRGGAQTSLTDFDKDAPGAARSMALPHSDDGGAVHIQQGSEVYEGERRQLHQLAPARLHEERLLQVTTMRQVAAAFASLRSIARDAKREARQARREAAQGGAQERALSGVDAADATGHDAESSFGVDSTAAAAASARSDSAANSGGGHSGAAGGSPSSPRLAADATAEEAHLKWKTGAGVLTVQALEESKARLLAKKADAKRIAKSVNACKKRIDSLVAELSSLPPPSEEGEGGGHAAPPAAAGSASAAVRSARESAKSGGEGPPSSPKSEHDSVPGENKSSSRGSARSSSSQGSKTHERSEAPSRGTGADTPADAVRGVEGGSSAQGKHEFTWDKQDATVKEESQAPTAKAEKDSTPLDAKDDSPTTSPVPSGSPSSAQEGGSGSESPDATSRRSQLVRDISEAKAEYRTLFAQLKDVKAEVAFLTQQLGGLKARALKEFDAWLAQQRQGGSAAGGAGGDGAVPGGVHL